MLDSQKYYIDESAKEFFRVLRTTAAFIERAVSFFTVLTCLLRPSPKAVKGTRKSCLCA
jgi:hypothetical protein